MIKIIKIRIKNYINNIDSDRILMYNTNNKKKTRRKLLWNGK